MPKPKRQTDAQFEADWEARHHSLTEQMLAFIRQWNTRKAPMGVPTRIRAKVRRNEALSLRDLKAFTNAVFCSTNHLKEAK